MGGAVSLITDSDTIKRNLLRFDESSIILNMILLDRSSRAIYRQFLSQEFSTENMDYYEAYENLKLLDGLENRELRPDAAYLDEFETLVVRFIKIGSEEQIDISDKLRGVIVQLLNDLSEGKQIGRATVEGKLELAQKEVCTIMTGTLERFLHSKVLSEYLDFTPPLDVINRQQPKQSLLLVEKDLLLGKLLSRQLEELRYIVTHVQNGMSATEHLMSQRYDVVVIAYELNDKNALKVITEFLRLQDLCRQRISQYSRPFIIGTLVKPNENIQTLCNKAGFDRMLIKPFTVMDIKAAQRKEGLGISHRISNYVQGASSRGSHG